MPNMLKLYRITNKASGFVLGDYQGATGEDALDAMSRDAGYRDHKHALQIANGAGLRVEIVEADDDVIEALRVESGGAGDTEMVAVCNAALNGNSAARQQCIAVLQDALAQQY
jgi:hypothetical protein